MRFIIVLLFICTALQAGDRWDYMLRTHSDITWKERNAFYLVQVAEKVGKKYGMFAFAASDEMRPFENSKWGYGMQSDKSLTVEEAAALLKKVYTDILNEIHKNKEAVMFLTEDVDAKTFPINFIGLKITFFQQNNQHVTSPHVARIYISDGHMYYNLSHNNELQQAIALN